MLFKAQKNDLVQAVRKQLLCCLLGLTVGILAVPQIGYAQRKTETKTEAKSGKDTVFVKDPELNTYFPVPRPTVVSVFKPNWHPLLFIGLPNDKTEIALDSLQLRYTIRRSLDGKPLFYPINYDFSSFAQLRKQQATKTNWDKLINEANIKRQAQRGLLDFKINIPGGEKSAFTTIFGKNELNLQVRGTADMTVGASVQQTDNPSLTETERKRVDPIFSQNLKLNIQGSIGDKLKIGTDWDSERMFDFENKLKLIYEGYDDEIIKSIEMGNVTMETGNSLIRGGTALFGIKSQLQLGALNVTSVVSQNEGKGNSQTIKGGSTEAKFTKKPADYEDRKHFLIDFYSYNNYERALANPILRQQLYNFSRINVWVSSISVSETSLREAIAMVDLGVDPSGRAPSPQRDIINDGLLNGLRQGNDSDKESIAKNLGINANDIFIGPFRQLIQGVDYTLDQTLGIISLRTALQDRQVLAVSFEYTDPSTGQRVMVGDLDQAGGRLILKMLRQPQLIKTDRTWNLTLRNTYSLDQGNLMMEGFKLDLLYTGGNNPTTNLPSIANPLLRDLGLDRVGPNGEPGADNQIDFSTGTLDPINGVIRFPYLQPFGDRILKILESNYPGADREEVIERLVFKELYEQQQENARQSPKNNFFAVEGLVKGGVKDSYQLGAFGLVEGSVRVTVGGRTLTEGVDYQVDYAFGSVTITNRSYLSSGQEVNIEYDSNDLVTIQKKSFTGVRAQYDLTENITFGGTWFRLRERPITDKIRIGDEPINNSVYGFDAKANFDTPWITRFIDKIPLLQTKAPSKITFSGEWARLTPGLGETVAVRRERKSGNLFPDEERGLSFIDDFEGSKTNVSLLNQGRWNLAAAPIAIPGLDDMDNYSLNNVSQLERQRRADHRAAFTWYMIPQNIANILGLQRDGDEVRQIEVTELFDRDVLSQDRILTPLDIYFNPKERGPYNFNKNVETLLSASPEKTWGGMTATILSGQQDFTINNIEFLEFWVQPVLPTGGARPSDALNYDGKLYIDLGTITEDIVPNFRLNTEDGLADNANLIVPDLDQRSYLLSTSIRFDGEFSTVNQEREDVGLDGASSKKEQPFNEQTLFADYLAHMSKVYANQPEKLNKLLADPANDDYQYYADNAIKGKFSKMQQYFLRYNGYLEGNTPRSTSSSVGNTNRPDTESLIVPGQVNLDDSYYQYEIPWNPGDPSKLRIGNSFIVDSVSVNERLKWYQVRIPLKEFTRKFGQIDNFQKISYIRLWMSGYREPLTMRFASLEFVGSQWRKAENVGNLVASTDFKIQTINSEENSNRRPIPYRVPRGTVRPIIRTQQGDLEGNEQALVLSVKDLRPNDLRMIRRNYTEGLNLINYSNLRMFVHGEGYTNRSNVELVIRLGRDLQNDYYEYRQPITPTNPRSDLLADNMLDSKDQEIMNLVSNEIWHYDQNSVNILLSVFNQLKLKRSELQLEMNKVFYDSLLIQATETAVPGAYIGIKGNPSLEKITEIGVGIANPLPEPDASGNVVRTTVPSLDADIWLNELRVSGFTETGGWAAKANTSIVLADFASINGNIIRSTDGFGALESRMGERDYAEKLDVDLSTTINLHKTIPDRFGWSFPLLLSARQSTSTPRFLPNEGDIRLDDFKGTVNSDPNLSDDQKKLTIDEKINESQTYSEAYSISLSSISKQNSDNVISRILIDNTKLSYAYSANNGRDPQSQYIDAWNYTTGIDYSLSVPNVRMARPFFFLEDVPVLQALSNFKLGYMPSNLSASAGLKRNYNERQRRALNDELIPVEQTHTFTQDSKFSLSYNLTPTIPLSFNSSTDFGLNAVGQYRNTLDTTRFDLRPTIDAFRNILQGQDSPRRNTYNEQYSASWRPNLQQIKFLDWFTTSTSYRGGFSWANSPEGSGLGSRVNNTFSIDHTTTLQTRKLFDKIPFYSSMKKADVEFIQQVQEKKAKRIADKQAAKLEKEENKKKAKEEAEKARQEAQKAKATFEKALAEWTELENKAKTDTTIKLPPKPVLATASKDTTTKVEPKTETKPALEAPPSLKEQVTGKDSTLTKVPEVKEPSALQKRLQQTGRRTVLSLMSLESFDVAYKHSTGSDQSGYRGGSQLWEAFANDLDAKFSPNPSYRLGFGRTIPTNQLIRNDQIDQSITLTGAENFKDDVVIRAKLSPGTNLTVDLDWSAAWEEKFTRNTTIQPDQTQNSIANTSGTIGASVWVFGPGFLDMYKKQLQTAFDDIQATPTDELEKQLLIDYNKDGRTLLNQKTLTEDFFNAYLMGSGRLFGKHGLMPLPLPGWNISLGGLETKIPFADRIISRISITHAYKGTISTGWFYNPTDDSLGGNVGVYSLLSKMPDYKPEQINLETRFSPLLGLSLTWKNGVSTNLSYETSNMIALNLDNSQVSERISNSIKFSTNFQKKSLKLPFVAKPLKNSIDFAINASYSEDETNDNRLDQKLEANVLQKKVEVLDINEYPIILDQPTGDIRIQFSTNVTYQFSATMKGGFEYRFSQVLPKSTATFRRLDQDFRFNIIVNIRSN